MQGEWGTYAMKENNRGRELLPGGFEARYKSEDLKEKIVDDGMWVLIPAVTGIMDSQSGINRLKENHLLFAFIDVFFPASPFAFEPNMRDGRFMFLPDDVGHQGIGICVSNAFPGFLEVGHFWYPCEFTEKKAAMAIDQVYISMFSARPGAELANMVQRIYMQGSLSHEDYCTFPFEPDLVVTLRGNFLDRMDESVKQIRDALKGRRTQIQRNGEGLISFMQRYMG